MRAGYQSVTWGEDKKAICTVCIRHWRLIKLYWSKVVAPFSEESAVNNNVLVHGKVANDGVTCLVVMANNNNSYYFVGCYSNLPSNDEISTLYDFIAVCIHDRSLFIVEYTQ